MTLFVEGTPGIMYYSISAYSM